MPSCVFKHCKNCSQNQRKEDGVSFHRFPTDPVLRDDWVSTVRVSRQDNNWLPSKFCVVCSTHFKEEDVYFTEKGRRLLDKKSKPTQNLCGPPREGETSEFEFVAANLSQATDLPGPSNEYKYYNTAASYLSVLIELPEESTEINTAGSQTKDSDLNSVFDTPRKSLVRKKLRKQQLLRSKKRNSSLSNILKDLKDKNFINSDTDNLLRENIVATEQFVNLNMHKSGKKKLKYTSAMRKFSLTLNFYSPKGYEYVRKTFNSCLPHSKTLAKWYTHGKSEPGFTQEAFSALQKITEGSSHKLLCSLMFDEMTLRQQKLWDGKRYIGVVDMGDEITESTALASQAFVFMLVGINKHFKMPLGYFLTNNLTGEQKSNLVKLCLTKCHEAGVRVVSLTFDGHATNFTTMRLLGCNITDFVNIKTTFPHPSDGSQVACFLDPSHVIKLLRNQLEAKKQMLNKDGKVVDWSYLVKLNKLQKEEGNKLSKRHISFRNQIMKVNLATQTLSRSVAKAMCYCRNDLNLPDFEQSQPTEEFIQLMNDMFDIFNSRSMAHVGYQKPIYQGNKAEIYALLDRLQNYVLNLQIKSVTKRNVVKDGRPTYVIKRLYKKVLETRCRPGFLGTLINISSLKFVFESLVENEKCLRFIPTYKLSQDHLEIFFGCVRMHAGHHDSPNVKQFKAIYRKLLTHLEIRSLETGNCIPLENIAILTCSSAVDIINSTSSSYRHDETEDDKDISRSLDFLQNVPDDTSKLAEYLDIPLFDEMRNVIVGYLTAGVIRFVRKVVKCEYCLTRLVATERQPFHKLIGLRDKGGLIFPSTDSYKVCIAAETVIRKILKENFVIKTKNDYNYLISKILKGFIGNETIFTNLEDEHLSYGVEHKLSLIKILLEKYLSVRLHYIAKKETNARCIEGKRQRLLM